MQVKVAASGPIFELPLRIVTSSVLRVLGELLSTVCIGLLVLTAWLIIILA